MSRLEALLDGIKNELLGMTEEQKEIAKKRAEICSLCPINKNNFCSKKRGGCGCSLRLKIKSFKGGNECPKKKW